MPPCLCRGRRRPPAFLEELFGEELDGHRLITNRSVWRQFPTIGVEPWASGNVVLLGDAAHTAHFSVGSGTRMAMEDAVALRDAICGEIARVARGFSPATVRCYN